MKNAVQDYVEAGYPQNTLEMLAYLESSSEHLEDLLESYRELQPDGKLFSVIFIEKIRKLHECSRALAWHIEERDYHEKKIERYEYEIYCLETGTPMMLQDEQVEGVPF